MLGLYQGSFRRAVIYVTTIKGRECRFGLRLAPRGRQGRPESILPARVSVDGLGGSLVCKRLRGPVQASSEKRAGRRYADPSAAVTVLVLARS